ncbi:D123-domain-containing protein [Polychaeton citri CBS 116435]|uniref:D123-domain-containing protein n=1 Tax=Polychaeton citri CBS 116435 TaxID=1314669 RepID=A0A9P4Q1I5_9PEZI|nr:D123-domain-containing protein [Polychaeton citri CBS 116435]
MTEQLPSRLPFPAVTKQHILNCSYHSWWPRYRAITPKARLIPLTAPFLDYLRADGIVLPDDDNEPTSSEHDSGFYSSDNSNAGAQDDGWDEDEDVSAEWSDVHKSVRDTIDSLGGRVMPKLNWSAPKDATWINANSMECRKPSDIYLLLKSSDFITHDLEHAFDDTEEDDTEDEDDDDDDDDDEEDEQQQQHDAPSEDQIKIPYHLVLRKLVGAWNPSLEFRCFVRNRRLIGICQRDLNHFDFLFSMVPQLRSRIQEFFEVRLRDTFPDGNFVFDVYVPPPHDRVWLVDVNPWAQRTDPLLFSWLELLEMEEPPAEREQNGTISLPIRPAVAGSQGSYNGGDAKNSDDEDDDDDDADEEIWQPEFRLIKRSDPEAYSFSTPQYSAHKLPKDVVDASQSGEGLREFAQHWKEILEKRQKEDDGLSASDEES